MPQKECGKRSSITFFVFGTLSVTFRSLFLMLLSLFSSLFCQTPFAGLLLRQGENKTTTGIIKIPRKASLIAMWEVLGGAHLRQPPAAPRWSCASDASATCWWSPKCCEQSEVLDSWCFGSHRRSTGLPNPFHLPGTCLPLELKRSQNYFVSQPKSVSAMEKYFKIWEESVSVMMDSLLEFPQICLNMGINSNSENNLYL